MRNNEEISLKLVYAYTLFLHLVVSSAGGLEKELIAVYPSPNPSTRRHLWGKLDEIEVSLPWVLVGDFNCAFKAEERSLNMGKSSSFQNWVEKEV